MGLASDYSSSEPSQAEVAALPGPVVLEFGNAWCGFCRRAQPLIEEALEQHPAIRHVRIADASGRRLGRSFRVKLWPTLIFLKDGHEVTRVVRPVDARDVSRAAEAIDS